ncbi:MAG TPA: enoyl-CoA hydratase/isomerase family protein [Bacillota bacterium]|nr:enoyl-CoA hydratase/isomerase family protein [Bacillota bacterium]
MDNLLKIEKRQDSTVILLQRPAKHNALNPSLLEDLRSAVLAAAPSLQLVIASTSPIFCSGLDLVELQALWPEFNRLEEYFEMLHQLYKIIYAHPAPTIAIVDKGAFGGGFGLACCCDLILAHPETRFVLPGDRFGNLARLARPPLVTKLVSLDLTATSPLEFTGQSAFIAGLCDSLIPLSLYSSFETFTAILESRRENRLKQSSQEYFARICWQIKHLVLEDLDPSFPPSRWKESD